MVVPTLALPRSGVRVGGGMATLSAWDPQAPRFMPTRRELSEQRRTSARLLTFELLRQLCLFFGTFWALTRVGEFDQVLTTDGKGHFDHVAQKFPFDFSFQ